MRSVGILYHWGLEDHFIECMFWLVFVLQIRDYSGTYTVKLIPCSAAPSGEFSIPPVCHPREPLTFDMDIRFQQVSPAQHSNTH